MKIKQLLVNKGTWTKGVLAQDKNKNIVPVSDVKAVSWCLVGAILKCYDINQIDSIFKEVCKEIGSEHTGYSYSCNNIIDYNNSPNRKFKDIKKLVNKLDI